MDCVSNLITTLLRGGQQLVGVHDEFLATAGGGIQRRLLRQQQAFHEPRAFFCLLVATGPLSVGGVLRRVAGLLLENVALTKSTSNTEEEMCQHNVFAVAEGGAERSDAAQTNVTVVGEGDTDKRCHYGEVYLTADMFEEQLVGVGDDGVW